AQVDRGLHRVAEADLLLEVSVEDVDGPGGAGVQGVRGGSRALGVRHLEDARLAVDVADGRARAVRVAAHQVAAGDGELEAELYARLESGDEREQLGRRSGLNARAPAVLGVGGVVDLGLTRTGAVGPVLGDREHLAGARLD